MTLEDIADLIRANSANTYRRLQELHAESYGQLLNLQNDVTDLRGDMKAVQEDVAAVRRSLDLAQTVAAMRQRAPRVRAELGWKWRACGGGALKGTICLLV